MDIGLFLLGKLFEETIKSFVVAAGQDGTYPVTGNNHTTLKNMIDWAKSHNVISDPTALNFLRQEHNERAHGTYPPLQDRQQMLNSAGWMASMYLDYILLLLTESWCRVVEGSGQRHVISPYGSLLLAEGFV